MPVDRDDFADALSYLFQSMSQKYIVFYGQQVYGEFENLAPLDLPDGCYVRGFMGNWYVRIGGGLTPINLSDIPPEVRLNCLLLGINI